MKPSAINLAEQLADTAKRHKGKKEVGTNRGAWVDSLNKRMGVPMGSAWCASFACGCKNEVEQKYGVKSPIIESAGVRKLFSLNKKYQRAFPQVGDFWCAGWVGTENGHMGVVTAVDPKGQWFETTDGNTSSDDPGQREGGVVDDHIRKIGVNSGNLKTLGFIRVFE